MATTAQSSSQQATRRPMGYFPSSIPELGPPIFYETTGTRNATRRHVADSNKPGATHPLETIVDAIHDLKLGHDPPKTPPPRDTAVPGLPTPPSTPQTPQIQSPVDRVSLSGLRPNLLPLDPTDSDDEVDDSPDHDCDFRDAFESACSTVEQANVIIALAHVPHGIHETARLRGELMRVQSENAGLKIALDGAHASLRSAQANRRPKRTELNSPEAFAALLEENTRLRADRDVLLAERTHVVRLLDASRARGNQLVKTLDEVFGTMHLSRMLGTYETCVREALARLYQGTESLQDLGTMIAVARGSVRQVVHVPVLLPRDWTTAPDEEEELARRRSVPTRQQRR